MIHRYVGLFSKTILLIPDFSSDVDGFLDRLHIGTSLIANIGLNKLMSKLRNRLSKHHLMCEFEGEKKVRLTSGNFSTAGNKGAAIEIEGPH